MKKIVLFLFCLMAGTHSPGTNGHQDNTQKGCQDGCGDNRYSDDSQARLYLHFDRQR